MDSRLSLAHFSFGLIDMILNDDQTATENIEKMVRVNYIQKRNFIAKIVKVQVKFHLKRFQINITLISFIMYF